MHLPVPVQARDQPLNFEPAFGDAVSVTTVPAPNACLHVAPHEIPTGLLVTSPLPVPDLRTVRSFAGANFAVTTRAAVIES